MDTSPLPAEPADIVRPENEADCQGSIAWEAHALVEARADVAAGRVVDASKVDAWINSLDTAHELPIPYSGK